MHSWNSMSSSSSTEQETSNSSTSEDGGKLNSSNSLMNGKNRNSSNGKKSPLKQQPQQPQNRCTWCAETKQPLKYVLPTQNGKKEFCSETCIAEFRKAYNKGACKECDNAIRGNAPNRDFCSTYCLNKSNKKKVQQSAPSTSQSQSIKTINNNNNRIENNNNSKHKSSPASSGAAIVENNNNNTPLIKEHYTMPKISPMFQYEAFNVFDWSEYLKVSSKIKKEKFYIQKNSKLMIF